MGARHPEQRGDSLRHLLTRRDRSRRVAAWQATRRCTNSAINTAVPHRKWRKTVVARIESRSLNSKTPAENGRINGVKVFAGWGTRRRTSAGTAHRSGRRSEVLHRNCLCGRSRSDASRRISPRSGSKNPSAARVSVRLERESIPSPGAIAEEGRERRTPGKRKTLKRVRIMCGTVRR